MKIEEPVKKQEGFQGQKAIVIPRSILTPKCNENDILESLYITDIGYYPKARHHYRERIDGADQHILIYCSKGGGVAQITGTDYELDAGDFIVIPANTPHKYEADEHNPWTIHWVHFKGTVANSIISSFQSQSGGNKGLIRNNEKIFSLFNEMYNQLERGYSTDNLLYTNMCFWHFLTLFMYNTKFNTSDEPVRKDASDQAIDYMSDRIGQVLGLEEIAHEVNLSASHFSFLFKKKTGFAPMEYFNHLKVQKACQYLLFTDLRVKEIAGNLGIEDPYYFSRLFTKVMGLSPNDYREKRSQ